jgi:peptidoglycan/xylan/chitin deacetylase (PgdA/CDA1 family)
MEQQKTVSKEYLPVYFRAETKERKIAVTVDDCDRPENLRRIVRIFDRCGAGLTLFPIGKALRMPGMAEMIRECALEKGMEIENHTMTHARIFRAPEAEMAREIWAQGQEVNRVLGVNYRQHFFRLMGGDSFADLRTHNYLSQLGFRGVVQWSCCGTDVDMEEIRSELSPGAIYLFHTVDSDPQKLEAFIPYAVSRGYRCVTLNELLGQEPNEIKVYRSEPMPAPRAYTEDHRICRTGEYSWNICRIQSGLMKMGLLTIEGDEPTGYYGELTEAAVRKFQAAHGLPVTGEADADTQNAIEAAAMRRQ